MLEHSSIANRLSHVQELKDFKDLLVEGRKNHNRTKKTAHSGEQSISKITAVILEDIS